MFIAIPPHDHCVYQLLARDGRVVYVGSSSAVFARLGQHAKTKDWWSQVAGIEVESFASKDEMLDRERELIEMINPAYNETLGLESTLAAASATLGRKVTREHVRAYVWQEIVDKTAGIMQDAGWEPPPSDQLKRTEIPEGRVSLRQYAEESGINLLTLQRWRERRSDFPSWVGLGARGVQLFERDHLKAYARERLREPVTADE